MAKLSTTNAINAFSILTTILPLFKKSGVRFATTLLVGFGAWFSMAESDGEKMIFLADKPIIYICLAFGIIVSLVFQYFFKYQNAKIEKEAPLLKFEWKYVFACFASLITGGIVAYLLTFHGVGYILPEVAIEELGLNIILCFALGGFSAWIVDALLWHPIVDGVAASWDNHLKAEALKIGQQVVKDPAVVAKIYSKAEALGLLDEVKKQKLAILVKGENDPAFAQYVSILKAQ